MRQVLIHRVYFSWLFVFSHVVFSRAADQAVGLRDYRLDRGPILIRGVRANASGLTYHADRDTLFCVLNSPQRARIDGLRATPASTARSCDQLLADPRAGERGTLASFEVDFPTHLLKYRSVTEFC